MKNKRKRTKSTGIKMEQITPGCKVKIKKCISYRPLWRGKVATIISISDSIICPLKGETKDRTIFLQLEHLDPAYGVVTPK